MKNTNKEIIESYSDILENLFDERLITENQFLFRDCVSSLKDVFLSLKKLNINERLIINKISDSYGIKNINDSLLNSDDYVITNDGIILENIYYLLNPFNIFNDKMKKNNSLYGNSFFDDIGIISSYDYNLFKKKLKSSLKLKTTNDTIRKININEVIFSAIDNDVNEIIINNGVEKILFSKNNNVFKSEFKTKHSFDLDIKNILKYKDSHYHIETVKMDDSLYTIKIVNHKSIQDFEKDEKKYKSVVFDKLKKSSGLLIFSEKYNTSYYHFFLNYAKKIHAGKKIISFENIKTKVDGVVQSNLNEEKLNKEILLESDMVFVENLDSEEKADIIFRSLNLGKFVFVNIMSQDSVTALNSIIHAYPQKLDQILISEKLLGVFHTTVLPKVCEYCSSTVLLKDHPLRRDDDFAMLVQSNDPYTSELTVSNKGGCPSCEHGYNGKILVSEFLDYDKNLAEEIENGYNIRSVRNLKDSKRWETMFINSLTQALKGSITLEDIKSKV
jgi:hypothetical protein